MPWTFRMSVGAFVLALPLYVYLAVRVSGAVGQLWPQTQTPARWVAAGVGVWMGGYPALLLAAYYGRMDRVFRTLRMEEAGIDGVLVYPFWVGVILVGQVVPYLVGFDLVKLVVRGAAGPSFVRWVPLEAWCVVLGVGLGAVFVGLRVWHDTCRVTVARETLTLAGLPDELHGLRVVHVSDVQADARTDRGRLQAYVDAVNRLRPDLVLFAGDLITRGTRYIDLGAEMVGKMEAGYGVYACLGDHDIWSDRRRIAARLEAEGVRVLENMEAVVSIGGAKVGIMGLTNAYSERPDLRRLKAGAVDASVRVLLAHQPSTDVVDFAVRGGYHLMAAGHTHGGQIAMGWFGWEFSPALRDTPYTSGFYWIDTMLLSVNNGLGFTLAPLRYRAPVQVTEIRLVAAGRR